MRCVDREAVQYMEQYVEHSICHCFDTFVSKAGYDMTRHSTVGRPAPAIIMLTFNTENSRLTMDDCFTIFGCNENQSNSTAWVYIDPGILWVVYIIMYI